MTETTAQLRLKLKQAKTEAARDRAERLDLMSKLDEADRQIDFWQADSATAWDKCEERRVAQIAAESRAERLEAALHNCVGMLDQLVAESGRDIEWGAEDPFRMGEWFEPEDLAQIEQARAALKGDDHE